MVFQIFELYDLPGLSKQHTTVVMVIFGTSIHNNPRFKFFKPENVKISGKWLFTKRSFFRAPVNTEQWVFRHRQAIKAMQIGQTLKMLHDLKIKQICTDSGADHVITI